MKLAMLALLLFSATAFAFEKVKINGKLYVASGFDDNDLVELTVVGTLPNTCYRNPSFEIEKKDNKFSVRLFAHYVPLPEGCREVAMAYTETINFGMMYAGEYGISLVNKSNTEKTNLVIKTASSGLVDEFLYGNVSGVIENDSSREIELVGANPVNCLVFDKMLTDVQNSMIVLRPQFKEMGSCENKSTPFKIKYSIPYLEGHAKGIMLHVRVMNGRSYNYLYQNRL
jgi:hypothetical protein